MNVPRSLFLPDLVWPLTDKGYITVDRRTDPDLWQDWVVADVPIVTQWDDGHHEGTETGTMATSSSSMPSIVEGMLHDLDVRRGHHVLDLGVGTGWTTAQLADRAGRGLVTGVEVDQEIAAEAERRIKAAGFDATVMVGDGANGWASGAPYDRVQVTYAVTEIRQAWLQQTRPGGLIVAPWRTLFAHHGAVVRLVVDEDGTATGRFTRPCEFMQARSERIAWPDHRHYLPWDGSWPADAKESVATLEHTDLWGRGATVAELVVGAQVPDVVHTKVPGEDGLVTVWLYSLTDQSWAAVFFDDGPDTEVYQGGERRLWDEVEAAYYWWTGNGRPDYMGLGLAVTQDGQQTLITT